MHNNKNVIPKFFQSTGDIVYTVALSWAVFMGFAVNVFRTIYCQINSRILGAIICRINSTDFVIATRNPAFFVVT
jgi:hypothetical protein